MRSWLEEDEEKEKEEAEEEEEEKEKSKRNGRVEEMKGHRNIAEGERNGSGRVPIVMVPFSGTCR